MGFAQLQHWARAQVFHDRVRVSTSRPADLLLPDVNVVHIKRCSPVHPKHIRRQTEELGVGFRSRVLASTTRPEIAAEELTRPLEIDEVREWLQDDIAALIGVFGGELGYSSVSAKLEVLDNTPCPRFHADHVGVRLLVSYCGPGTVFLENRHARRRWLWGGAGGVAVAEVDASQSRQASAGDLLFLKGHAAPGNYGMGAVHRSPDMLQCLDAMGLSRGGRVDAKQLEEKQAAATLVEEAEGASLPRPAACQDGLVPSRLIQDYGFAAVVAKGVVSAGAESGALRLLLTVDDVTGWASEGQEACGCGQAHGSHGGHAHGKGASVVEEGMGAHRADASLTVH